MINRVFATMGLMLALTLALSGTAFAGDVGAPIQVPEPTTSLLLLGGLGVAWWGARRRSK
jgi:hypothetical protein